MDLTGKNVIFVGGFSGIGFATCKEMLTKNLANLIIMDLKTDLQMLNELKSINQLTNVRFMHIDITIETLIRKCFENVHKEIGEIHVLINCSGIFNELTPKLTIDINLTGLISTCLIAIPQMKKGSLIVNVASVLGLEPFSGGAIYTASKHGVIGFTKSLADDYCYPNTEISVMAICPGITATNLIVDLQNKGTFTFSAQAMEEFAIAKNQTAQECAVNFVKAIETNKNGSIWKLDCGKLEEIHLPNYWKMEF